MRAVSGNMPRSGTPAGWRVPRELRDGLLYGLSWGLAVWILETTPFALARGSIVSSEWLLAAFAIFWCTRGVALAWAAAWLATRLRPALAWALFPVIAMLLSLAWDGSDLFAAWSARLLRAEVPRSGMLLFTLWPMLIYGAPLFALCLSDARARRGRALLAQAEAARMHSATAIDAARFELLSHRVDPQQLLRSLEAMRHAVAAGDARANTHLDSLVDFLRAAMPVVRSVTPASVSMEDFRVNKGGSDERR